MGESREVAHELVFAVAHEIGNHLGGIRLQAHLIDEEFDVRSLAEASIAIDEMAGRSGRLLALMRPIRADVLRNSSGEGWSSLLGRVRQQIEDEGTRGARFELEYPAEDSHEAPPLEWIHSLLVVLVGATIAHVGSRGSVVVALEKGDDVTILSVEDDGEEEDLSPEGAYRGRPLALALARELLGRAGGRVEARRCAKAPSPTTRVELVFSNPR